jgi:beta-glucanase (GH16 family)
MKRGSIYPFAITLWCLLNGACTAAKKSPANAYSKEGYALVWADEFTKTGPPDSMYWRFEEGFVRNQELQWYQPDNARCNNGKLIIEGRKESRVNPAYDQQRRDWRSLRPQINYTSSSINTSGKRSWLYGRFVMRGKIDISDGLWPAWWTLGNAGRWPANGEIDIMEYYKNKLLFNVACLGPDKKPEWFSVILPVDSLGGSAWASLFHVWRMDWDESSIKLFVDDVLINDVSLSAVANKDGSGVNPFKQPHYILLNLAIGGMNGGSPDNTIFPNRFEVDYVRVYQKATP